MIRSWKCRKILFSLLPSYAWIPLISALLLNCLVYFGNRVVTTGRFHFQMWTRIDDFIPFISWFVVFYILAYVQWLIGFVLIGRAGKAVCFSLFSAEMIAKVICLLCFLLIPTTLVRPSITGHTVFDDLTRLIYSVDSPDNLFPSIHCLESWFCLRSCRYLKKIPHWYFPVTVISTIMVFLSTVMIKQHVAVDMIGAIFAMEIGLAMSRFLHTGRFFAFINRKLTENFK